MLCILANTARVVVSYGERVQDRKRYFWDVAEVEAKLDKLIRQSFGEVLDAANRSGTTLRVAAQKLAVGRVCGAILDRGIYP